MHNPECLQWKYEQVQASILGGIRIEALDRMRVTLKIDFKEQVVRHNLDLFNDAGVDRLIKRCAERFPAVRSMFLRTASLLNKPYHFVSCA
jgi:hypothetical protein